MAFRLPRFQYRYPGTPINTMAVPQKASVGRVMMVFSVQAAPTSTEIAGSRASTAAHASTGSGEARAAEATA